MATKLDEVIDCLEKEIKALALSPHVSLESLRKIQKCFSLIAPKNVVVSNGAKTRAQRILYAAKNHSTDLFVLCALSTNQRLLGEFKWTPEESKVLWEWWKNVGEKPADVLGKAFRDAIQESGASKLQDDPPTAGSLDNQVAGNLVRDAPTSGSLDSQIAGNLVRDAPTSGSLDSQIAGNWVRDAPTSGSLDSQIAGNWVRDAPTSGSLDIQVAGNWVRDALRGKEDDKFWLRCDSNGVWAVELSHEVQKALIVIVKMREMVRN